MKSTMTAQSPPKPGHRVRCPRCHQLLMVKKPPRGFRCSNGHEFPVEALLVLKAQRLEKLLREPLTSLEKLTTDLEEAAVAEPAEDVQSAYDHLAAAAARQVERLRRAIEDDVVVRALSVSPASGKAKRAGVRGPSSRDRARQVRRPLPSEPASSPAIVVLR